MLLTLSFGLNVAGGMASARRGLLYGVWLGGLFGMFRNHVASLREQARLEEEDKRLAEVRLLAEENRGLRVSHDRQM